VEGSPFLFHYLGAKAPLSTYFGAIFQKQQKRGKRGGDFWGTFPCIAFALVPDVHNTTTQDGEGSLGEVL
jgi:hypothetical protein